MNKTEAPIDEKDKKISQLRNLLAAAKGKIEQLKSTIVNKDKQLSQLRAACDKKIKDSQSQLSQIIKQYQQRTLRYQKSLQESQQLKAKYQAQATTNSQSYKIMSQALNQIGLITLRIFTLKPKDNNEAVQQLCNIQKCKQFIEQIQKIQKTAQTEPVIKSTTKLTEMILTNLQKKRQSRLLFTKKETQFKKTIEQMTEKSKQQQNKIFQLQNQINKIQSDWKLRLQEINKSKLKMSEQLANLQFIKQLLLKIFLGPKQASFMALQVLAKVLKMTQDQVKICSKKIK